MGPVIAVLAASYLVGSFPTAFLLVKLTTRQDVRMIGSGNVGATNALRAAGKVVGAVVFLVDASKGLLAARVLAPWLLPASTPALQFGCGVAAVVGHCFPVVLRFRGGKGVATTIGLLVGTMPGVAVGCLAIWSAGFLLSRYVSFASLLMAVALPIA